VTAVGRAVLEADGFAERLTSLHASWSTALDRELAAAVALRHELHANPDVSGVEAPTARRVVRAITAPGDWPGRIEAVAGTGRLLRTGPDGPAVGLRAEMDALPMAEATGAPFASRSAAMHACGHDVHLAAIAAVARAARGLDLPYGLAVLLQPREEVGPTGAQDVVREGVLAARDVRVLVAAHVQPLLPAGAVASDPGPVNAAVDEFEIVVTGRGGHGAYPHLAVDPVPALCRTVLALQDALRSSVDPLHPAVVSVTQLKGAGAPNVIPDAARAAGTIRTMRASDAAALHGRIAATVRGVAEAHGCSADYVVRRGEPPLDNDPFLAAAARAWLDAAGLPSASFASCGSDDFATYGQVLPILMLFVGTGEGPAGPILHDPRYLPDDDRVHDVAHALLVGWLAGAELLSGERRP
jgi:amidohydrolase